MAEFAAQVGVRRALINKEFEGLSTTQQPANVASEGGANAIINGQTKPVPSRDVTWEQIVDLAFPGERSDPDLDFIVTYEDADQAKDDGTLGAGNNVRIKDSSTVFHVKKHRRS